MPTWQQPEEEADLLTIAEAARILGVYQSTGWRWINSGEMFAVTLPSLFRRKYRVRRAEVERIRRGKNL